MHEWIFSPDASDVDRRFRALGDEDIGATIMGRKMFRPVRGPWGAENWTGWWGADPPFHHDVFVLTHHARDPVPMAGGTMFHFVTDGIESAVNQAKAAAAGKSVGVHGADTIQQLLNAGLLDEISVDIAAVLLGSGVRLFDHLAVTPAVLGNPTVIPGVGVTHLRYAVRKA